jgi:coenzyme F420-reducing hydrogenase beta subunit
MWHNNPEILRKSSSGGAFMAAAQAILSDGGCVFGCVTDENKLPVHVCAQMEQQLAAMQHSKYCQSDTTNVFLQVKEKVKSCQKVLFTGTPCQVAGLNKFLKKTYENLYTIDLICHGVPSPAMYLDYLSWLEKKYNGIITDYIFRSKKKHGWSLTTSFDVTKNGKKKRYEKISSLLPYDYGFLSAFFFRESCYVCPFAQNERVGDMTIGDFWGIERINPSLYNSEGVSCLLVNTEKGCILLKQMRKLSVLNQVSPEDIIRNNRNLQFPSIRPEIRDTICNDWRKLGFDYIAKEYCKAPNSVLLKIKDMIPNHLRQSIKKIFTQIMKWNSFKQREIN